MERQRRDLSLADVAGWGSALVTFGLVQGALYLQGYWGRFGLEPFQFVAVGELALAGLAGVGAALGFMLLAALFGSWLEGKITNSRPQPKWKSWAAIVALMFASAAFIWWTSAWAALMGVILSVVSVVVVMLSPAVPKAIKDSPWLIYIVLMLVYVSIASSWLGSERAKRIVEGNGKSVSVVSTEKETVGGLNLIGRLGDTYAFWDPTRKTTMLVPAADVRRVEVTRKGTKTASGASTSDKPQLSGTAGKVEP